MSTSDGPGPTPEPGEGVPGAGERPVYLRLANELADLGRSHRDLVERVTLVASDLSETLPRLGDVEEVLERLGVAIDAGAVAGDGSPRADDLTPATRWSQLDHDELAAAWAALGGWVAEVLNGEYEVSRAQLPDCWPVHRRAVRELAWLRTLHVAACGSSVSRDVVAEWHSRWLPAALYNVASAIDARECAPGRHRVTDAERRHFERQVEDARAGPGADRPVLTTERGPGRPRYVPQVMPPRRGRDEDVEQPRSRAAAGPVSLDDLTPAPVSEPEHWWPYLLEAQAAELASARDRASTGPS